MRPVPTCRCGQFHCNCARWNEIFEARHGDEERAYYAESTIRHPQSCLSGITAAAPDLSDASIDAGDGGADRERWRREITGAAFTGRLRRELRAYGAR